MKLFLRTLISSAPLLFFTFAVSAHPGDDARVEIELETPSRISAGPATVEFQLVDTKANAVLSINDLATTHEKKLHLIVYDPGLREFQHVHPEFDDGFWKADLNFTVNGVYFVWAQGQIENDGEEFGALVRIDVTGGIPAWPTPVLGDVRTGQDSGTIATLARGTIRAGQHAMLPLKFSRADGNPVVITPYLGAFAHIIATPLDGDSLLHVHPTSGSSSDQGMLHATFPLAGEYRLWIQFIDGGILKTVPLSVRVTN